MILDAETRDRIRAARDAAVRASLGPAGLAEQSPRKWNRPTALEAIRDFVAAENREPTRDDLSPPRLPSERTLRRIFGSVRDALAASRPAVDATAYEIDEPLRLFAPEAA